MSKFSKGDAVRVTSIEHAKFDQVGVVLYSSRLSRSWKYGVQFGTETSAIWEHELTLADPDVHTVLDQMDAESGFVNPLAGIKPPSAEVAKSPDPEPDPVNRPAHYTSHPSGIECIQVTEHMGFNLGSATKYLWRCDLKENAIQDLEKAVWYIQREIAKRKSAQ